MHNELLSMWRQGSEIIDRALNFFASALPPFVVPGRALNTTMPPHGRRDEAGVLLVRVTFLARVEH